MKPFEGLEQFDWIELLRVGTTDTVVIGVSDDLDSCLLLIFSSDAGMKRAELLLTKRPVSINYAFRATLNYEEPEGSFPERAILGESFTGRVWKSANSENLGWVMEFPSRDAEFGFGKPLSFFIELTPVEVQLILDRFEQLPNGTWNSD